MGRLRLVKVLVQPFFVDDDGETLTEHVANPVEVAAKDWPTFATDKFPAGVAELEAQLNAELVTEIPQPAS